MREKDRLNMAELEKELQSFIVKYPDENKINDTIQALRPYLPKEKEKNNPFMDLIRHAISEVSMIRRPYWLLSLLLFAIGYFVITTTKTDPLKMLIILAPLPFVLGLFEVFRGREEGVLELEMTCKFSAYEIILSRLLIISLYNFLLSIVLTITLSSMIVLPLFKVIITWFAPLIMFSVLALSLSMTFRGHAFIVTVISCWLIFALAPFLSEALTTLYLGIPSVIQLSLIIIGLILLSFQVKKIKEKFQTLEGVVADEINY